MSIINLTGGYSGDELGTDLISARDLVDTLQDSIATSINEWLIKAWNWTMGASFWIACIGCVALIIIYATSMDKKYKRKASVLFIIYVILKGIDCVV